MTAMSAGLLDYLQALSKSSEPLESTLMSTWLRSSQPSSTPVEDGGSTALRGGHHQENSGGSFDGQGHPRSLLKEFSTGNQGEKMDRLEGLIRGLAGYAKGKKKPAFQLQKFFFLPHPGLRSTEEDHGAHESTLLAGVRGGRLHTVLDEK
ncbi:unnamed protein product [Trichogramma brassicae]|uniref:Uncharacterized protein n=1 Tax=Trichogramma brassicae TaxID=86971 RepID=A0A6H5JAM3_9HYME|nr:unnamed protein product [Trichogramma brassicae]